MNDELIVSNDIKATPHYIFVFVQDKLDVVNANAYANKDVLTAHLVKSLFPSLGASKVSQSKLSLVESLSSTNVSIATTTFVNKESDSYLTPVRLENFSKKTR